MTKIRFMIYQREDGFLGSLEEEQDNPEETGLESDDFGVGDDPDEIE